MKPRHESEHYQHADVDGTRDAVSAGQVLDQCLVLQRDREPKLCNDGQSKCDETDEPCPTVRANCRESSQHIARGKEDGGGHEGRFSQLGPALTDAWNDERNSDDAEKEASTKNEGEIDESRAKGAEHGWRVRAAALAGPHVRHERGHGARSGFW